ncbi:hypothetical protein [Parasitella parasitica]|uniref:FAR1 domain-containing protein n=1 Tax=Parasitella parasitica TaxID=35722 RepID=A0A0B7NHK8_9FUNG|nr:hypothetical protein [Parasitella parasitica]
MVQYSALNKFTFKIKTKKVDVRKTCVSIWLQCDRQGKPAAFTADKSSQSFSERCGCKVDIRIQKSNDGFLIHRKNLVHNHPCEERDVVGHITNRDLSKKHLDFLREQIGVFSFKPAAVLEALRLNFPENNFHFKYVYNAVAQLRAEVLDGRTPVQQLRAEVLYGRTPVQMLVDPATEMTDYSFDIKFN